MMNFSNEYINIKVEESEIPWLVVFTNEKYKELSHCPKELREEIFRVVDIIERAMLDYYNCDKVNIASFGNYVPHVHFHVMARFKEDSYFPEPMWGKKQREANLSLPNFEEFCKIVETKLKEAN